MYDKQLAYFIQNTHRDIIDIIISFLDIDHRIILSKGKFDNRDHIYKLKKPILCDLENKLYDRHITIQSNIIKTTHHNTDADIFSYEYIILVPISNTSKSLKITIYIIDINNYKILFRFSSIDNIINIINNYSDEIEEVFVDSFTVYSYFRKK